MSNFMKARPAIRLVLCAQTDGLGDLGRHSPGFRTRLKGLRRYLLTKVSVSKQQQFKKETAAWRWTEKVEQDLTAVTGYTL
jgi:hypothetical protein